MPNNIKALAPNAIVAKATIDFVTAGIDSTNTEIIYLVDDPLKSYVPGRAINGITGFVADQGYYLVAKTAIDLTAYVVPPVGGGVVTPTLATPTNFLATAGDAQVVLTWTPTPNATGYVITRATDAGFTANVSNVTLSFQTGTTTITGLTNGTTYYFRIAATAAGYNNSGYANDDAAPAAAGGSYDADAQAYFTTAGVTNTTEKNLWNDFVVGAKADDFWNDVDVWNPLLGSTAAATAINAKNPAAHAITWYGTVTHNADGITGDGTSGYGVMAYNPSQRMSVNGAFAAAYVVNSTPNNQDQMMVFGAKDADSSLALVADYFNITFGILFNEGQALNQNSTTERTGVMVLNRTSNTSAKFWRNGVLIEEVTGDPVGPVSNALPNGNLAILAQNDIGNTQINSLSSDTIGFLAFGGTGLNDTKRAAFEARLQTLMTGLGR